MSMPIGATPPHIPESLVFDFDFFQSPELKHNAHHAVTELLHNKAPEIFYTPRYGGHWIVTRAAVARDMLRQPEHFSSRSEFNPARRFEPPLLPMQVDPPDHGEYRRIINTILSPSAVGEMEDDIRGLAREIIDDIHPRGRCDFIPEVAQRFPVTVFLRMAGAPLEDRHRLVKFADGYARSPSFDDRVTAVRGLATYLMEGIDARRKNPGNDLLSYLLSCKFKDRPLTSAEIEGLATQVFLGGLDTVKSFLSFLMLYLAKNPDQYRKLLDDRASIPQAIEELLRVNGISVPERGATHDFDYRGVPFRKGDRIVFLAQIYGLDDQMIEDPHRIDFDRKGIRHLTFGAGPHRCAGAQLARLEIKVLLEEWSSTFREFHIENNVDVEITGGIVWSPVALPLAWPIN
jgi:cytochrome P450